MNIEEIRQQYPQYSDMSDEQLAKALHQKFYSDLPYEQFSAKVGLAQPQPERSAMDSLGRQLGLTARAGVQGFTDLANMALDPAVRGINKVAGTNLSVPSEAQDRLLNRFLPQPDSDEERIANQASRAMIPTAGIAKAAQGSQLFAPLGQRVGSQIVSAGAAGGSSQAAKDAGANELEQALAGLGGGIAAPTALAAGQTGLQAAGRFARTATLPLTQSGRQEIAARVLKASASNPDAAAANIQNAQSFVPGVRPFTAEVAEDPGLSSLYKTLRNQNTPAFTDVEAANDMARQEMLRKAFGGQTDLDAAIAAREAATRGLREQALKSANQTGETIGGLNSAISQKYASKTRALQDAGQMQTAAAQQQSFADSFTPVPGMPRVPARISPNIERVPEFASGAQQAWQIAAARQAEMQALQAQLDAIPHKPLLTDPIIGNISARLNAPGMRASDVVQKTLSDVQQKLAGLTRADGTIDAQDLYTVRKELGSTIEKYAGETKNWDKRLTAGVQRGIQKSMDEAIVRSGGTDWPKYLREYADRSKKIEAMQTGQEIASKGVNPMSEKLSPAAFARLMENRKEDVASMGAQGSDALTRVNMDLKRSVAPLVQMRTPGSDTLQNLASTEVLTRMLGHVPGAGPGTRLAAKGLNLLYTPFENQTKQLLVDAMIDPKLAQGLLGKKIPQKADLTAELLKKLLPISYGGLLGTIGAQ